MMTQSYLPRLASTRAGALYAFLTFVAMLPSTAEAGCWAHYVASKAQEENAYQVMPGLAIEFLTVGEESAKLPTAPCSGVLCSGESAPVPPLAPSVSPPSSVEWAIASDLPSRIDLRWVVWHSQDANLSTTNEPTLIFHPPRAGRVLVVS